MMFFSTYMKVAIKNYYGRCTVKGCEKIIAAEPLICTTKIGNNDYALCVDHSQLSFKGELEDGQIEIENYLKWPSKEKLRQAMLETTKIIAEALQE